jgi:hypothetical protein
MNPSAIGFSPFSKPKLIKSSHCLRNVKKNPNFHTKSKLKKFRSPIKYTKVEHVANVMEYNFAIKL